MRKYYYMLFAVLLSLFILSPFAYGDSLTWNMIVDQIENMEKSYTQQDWSGTGSIKSHDLGNSIVDKGSVFFENNDEIFDDITIMYYGYEADKEEIIKGMMYEETEIIIDGRRVYLIQKEYDDEDGHHTIIYAAQWINGPFIVSISSTGIKNLEYEARYPELQKMISMINKALNGINPGIFENETADEVNSLSGVSLAIEKNQETGLEYEGMMIGADANFTMIINYPEDFEGSFYIEALKYGELEKQKTESSYATSPYNELVYKAKDYLVIEGEYIVETFRIHITDKNDVEKILTKTLKLYKPPVFLVHGFTGDASTWEKLAGYLEAKGYDTIRKSYYYEDASGQGIQAQSRALGLHIKEKLDSLKKQNIKTSRVDIVAHSMGGLISRYLISNYPEYYQDNVRKLIMVGTPNHGCGSVDKIIGWYSAYSLGAHEQAASQLVGKNPFILELNKFEKSGKHLDPNVQYGLIYGTGTLLGDGVVTDTSAILNGVTGVAFPGLTHSPAVSILGPSMTLDEGVFDQIETWLTSDIPKGRFVNMDMRIYAYEGEAYKQNPNVGPEDGPWIAITESDDLSVDEYESLMTGNGKMTILLKSGMNVFGTVDLAENTEMYFEYASPHMMRVSIIKGSAKFSTKYDSDYHFETRLETTLHASNNIQIVRGYKTEYVVKITDVIDVYCVDGSLQILNASNIDDINTATLKSGQAAQLLSSGGFEQISIPTDKWWEDKFYDKNTFDYYLKAYNIYIYSGVALLILLLLMISKAKGKRKRIK